MSFYEIAVSFLGVLPEEMRFLYSVFACSIALATVSTVIALILFPVFFFNRR